MPAKKGKVAQDAGANDPPEGACVFVRFLFGNFVRICSGRVVRFLTQVCCEQMWWMIRFRMTRRMTIRMRR